MTIRPSSGTETTVKIFLHTANHIATMPCKVFEQLLHHPLTGRGLARFLKDWEKARVQLGEFLQPAAARLAGR
jgi:hypothetical protein